jgi:hypothetical protein
MFNKSHLCAIEGIFKIIPGIYVPKSGNFRNISKRNKHQEHFQENYAPRTFPE